ncbi:MAG: hypothetical protein P4L10_17075 [Acidobacteriaceae bacterium]|nr:hypothetical protein [Acidobacteriaceae bacterium]
MANKRVMTDNTVESADDSVLRPHRGSHWALGTSEPEFYQLLLASGSEAHADGVGADERRITREVNERGFEKLAGGERTLKTHEGLAREDELALRDAVDLYLAHIQRGEIIEESRLRVRQRHSTISLSP